MPDVETRPLLLSGRSDGRICIWDLSDRSLVAITQRLHDAPLRTMAALKGEPLVITAANDNAVKGPLFPFLSLPLFLFFLFFFFFLFSL